jgi:uncharacterized protein YdeI (YjbR/CyaY-like superfamily)
MRATRIVYFEGPAELGKWLEKHHASEAELWVGYYKKDSGRPSLTWAESVDEALCRGWIDGIRKSIDDRRYTIRFTPRKPGSVWSAINIRRAEELIAAGRMRPRGLEAFRARREDRARIYSYEQAGPKLGAGHQRRFKADPKAWKFFRTRTDWYRRTASWWVVSAKKEETREKRLAVLITCSREERPIPALPRAPEKRRSK